VGRARGAVANSIPHRSGSKPRSMFARADGV
jgi:hypothetical protein